MSNVIEYPAGRVHKRYAANIPRYEAPSGHMVRPFEDGDHGARCDSVSASVNPGVLMLGLITLWAMWCAGVR